MVQSLGHHINLIIASPNWFLINPHVSPKLPNSQSGGLQCLRSSDVVFISVYVDDFLVISSSTMLGEKFVQGNNFWSKTSTTYTTSWALKQLAQLADFISHRPNILRIWSLMPTCQARSQLALQWPPLLCPLPLTTLMLPMSPFV
ncbi:LOW QUALITY PROTEIN: hypothetical protein V2J09_021920 [Rumex salicifolius]